MNWPGLLTRLAAVILMLSFAPGSVPRAADLSDSTSTAPIGAPAAAQASAAVPASTPTLRPGVWALEFEYEPELFRGPDRSATISAKRHFSRSTALRTGVVINYAEDESESRTFPPGSTTSSGIGTSHSESRDVSFFTHLVRYLHSGERFGVFVEAGPFILFSDGTGHRTIIAPDGSSSDDHNDSRATSWGLQAGPGFEWFFTRRVSLGARWGASVSYGNDKSIRQSSSRTSAGVFTPGPKYRSDSRFIDGRTTPSVVILTAYL